MTTTETRYGVLHGYEQGEYIAGSALEGRLDWDSLEELWDETVGFLESVASDFDKPVVAVSGGVDGMVLAHMCTRAGITDAMNIRTPEEYPSNQEYLDGMLARWGFDVAYYDKTLMDFEWLRDDPDLRLLPEHSERGHQLNLRQARGLKDWPTQQDDVDAFIQGRRKQHNKNPFYTIADDRGTHWSFDPILEYKWEHVISYADEYSIPISPAYRVHTQSVGEPWFKPPRHTAPDVEVKSRAEAWYEIRSYCLRHGYTEFWRYIVDVFDHGAAYALDWAVENDISILDVEEGYQHGCDVRQNPAAVGPAMGSVDVHRSREGVGESIYAALDPATWDRARRA